MLRSSSTRAMVLDTAIPLRHPDSGAPERVATSRPAGWRDLGVQYGPFAAKVKRNCGKAHATLASRPARQQLQPDDAGDDEREAQDAQGAGRLAEEHHAE